MDTNPSIIRKRKTNNFVQIDNDLAQDMDLSLEAKGLLLWIFSLPTDWDLNLCFLYNPKYSSNSKYKIQKVMKEICDKGYGKLERRKISGSTKFSGSRYIVAEDKSFASTYRDTQIPTIGKSATTNTYVKQTHIYDERDGGLEEPKATNNSSSLLTNKNDDGVRYGYTVDDWYTRCEEKGLMPGWTKEHESFKCLCPIHNEDKPSFNVSKGEKVAVICNCFGCNYKFDDFSAVLFPNSKNSFSDEMHFVYTDEEDHPLFKVSRTKSDKRFWTQIFKDGKWVNAKESEVQRVPYRLHKLVKSDGLVYIVEGEKDVETAEKHGLTATCNPFGASAWKSTYANYFKGKDVVIVRDKDEAGIKWSDNVKASINHLAKSVKIVESPIDKVGADLTDHYDAGLNLSQLRLVA